MDRVVAQDDEEARGKLSRLGGQKKLSADLLE